MEFKTVKIGDKEVEIVTSIEENEIETNEKPIDLEDTLDLEEELKAAKNYLKDTVILSEEEINGN